MGVGRLILPTFIREKAQRRELAQLQAQCLITHDYLAIRTFLMLFLANHVGLWWHGKTRRRITAAGLLTQVAGNPRTRHERLSAGSVHSQSTPYPPRHAWFR